MESGIFLTAPASFISAGNKNEYILAMLCSKLGKYYIYQNSDTTGAGDIMLNIQSLVKFPIPQFSEHQATIQEMMSILNNALDNDTLQKIDYLIYKMIILTNQK